MTGEPVHATPACLFCRKQQPPLPPLLAVMARHSSGDYNTYHLNRLPALSCRPARRCCQQVQCSASPNSNCPGPSASSKKVDTKFVAETLLPTRGGKFRVRAYRHTVRPARNLCVDRALVQRLPGGTFPLHLRR